MIVPNNPPKHNGLVLLFLIDEPEQAEALHNFRAAFGAATEIEAVDENLFALHIRPGLSPVGEGAA
jgi:hypothetical protein